MQLQSLAYREKAADPTRWSFGRLDLGAIGLLVGMNASGKTRTLNVINGLAALVSGQLSRAESGEYDVTFAADGGGKEKLRYSFAFREARVIKEKLTHGRRILLDRRASGKGRIRAEKLSKPMIEFQVPKEQLACVAKRDSLQHPFLEKLHEWGASVSHFRCCTLMGKDTVLVLGEGATSKGDLSVDPHKPISTFLAGCNRFGLRKFKTPILRDMKAVGYPLRSITVAPPISVSLSIPVGEAVTLNARERDLACQTDQNSMSEGMFRALALIIQLNYAILADPSCCVLIDDIGEGLDYDRSNALLKVVRQKALDGPMQLVMATNDRFVMNNVPLKEWQIVERVGPLVRFRNYENSRSAFDDFEYTGLSNFDFFRSGMFADE